MKLNAEHFIEFIVEGNESIELPPVSDPVYIYTEGDIIVSYPVLYDKDDKTKQISKFEVTAVEHEIYDSGVGEQVIKVYVKKIK